MMSKNIVSDRFKTQYRIQFFILACLVMVGWSIPEDVLTRYEWARNYTDFMRGIFPSIGWVENLGVHVEINAFYQAFLWPFGILFFIYFLFHLEDFYNDRCEDDGKIPITVKYIIYLWVAMPLLLFRYGVFDYFQEFGAQQTLRRPTHFAFANRFGRGIMVTAYVTGYCMLFAMYLIELKFAMQRRFKLADKNDNRGK